MNTRVTLLCTALAVCSAARAQQADTIYTNGKIYTVNEGQPWAEAVAIKDGKFLKVGSDEDLKALLDDTVDVVDLKGRLVLPGLMDPHIHPSMDALNPADGRLPGGFENPTFEAIDAKLRELKNNADAGTEWVVTFGHEKSVIPEERYNRQWLDEIFDDIPVFLEDQTGHGALVNSKALELAKITKDTPDPPGSHIIKDAKTGEPTGSLVEEGAMGMVRDLLPAPTIERRMVVLRGMLKEMHENGVTAFGDAKTMPVVLPAWEAYFKKYGREHHVALFMHSIDSEGVESIQRAKDLKRAFGKVELPGVRLGAKVYSDGSIEGQTALLVRPYLTRKNFLGALTVPEDTFQEVIADLDEAGIQVKIHAIGDGAVRKSLDAFEKIVKRRGDNALRHHIDHLNLVNDNDIPRFKELRVPAGPYPLLAQPFGYQTSLVMPQLGEQRWQADTLPIRKLLDSGAVVGAKTDWSSAPLNPFLGMQVALTRQVPDKPELGTLGGDNAISLEQVIQCYTLNNAFILHLEDVAGSIEVGKQADLIVLDTDLFEVVKQGRIDLVSKTKVLKTVFAGQIVYDPLADN